MFIIDFYKLRNFVINKHSDLSLEKKFVNTLFEGLERAFFYFGRNELAKGLTSLRDASELASKNKEGFDKITGLFLVKGLEENEFAQKVFINLYCKETNAGTMLQNMSKTFRQEENECRLPCCDVLDKQQDQALKLQKILGLPILKTIIENANTKNEFVFSGMNPVPTMLDFDRCVEQHKKCESNNMLENMQNIYKLDKRVATALFLRFLHSSLFGLITYSGLIDDCVKNERDVQRVQDNLEKIDIAPVSKEDDLSTKTDKSLLKTVSDSPKLKRSSEKHSEPQPTPIKTRAKNDGKTVDNSPVFFKERKPKKNDTPKLLLTPDLFFNDQSGSEGSDSENCSVDSIFSLPNNAEPDDDIKTAKSCEKDNESKKRCSIQ